MTQSLLRSAALQEFWESPVTAGQLQAEMDRMARGTREFPEQSGAVSGILYAGIALGGMVFPLAVGALAQNVGIARSYWFCAASTAGLLAAAVATGRRARPARA